MTITFETFEQWCNEFDNMFCANPSYIPSREEIAQLQSYTQKIRTKPVKIASKRMGRPLKSESSSYRFVLPNEEGMPYVTEEDFFRFLVYVNEKAVPDTDEGKANQKYLSQYLRENLIITD